MSSNSKQNQLPTEEAKVDDAYLSALLLSFGRIFPAILNAAIDLNLFEIISKSQSTSGMSASEIASKLPNQHPDLANRLERMLPLLASHSLLTCSIRDNEDGKKERVYALSPIGAYFIRDKDGGCLAPFSAMVHRGFHDLWKDVKEASLDPNNNNHFQKVYGMLPYQYMETNKLGHMFDQANAQSGTLGIRRALSLYRGFEGVSMLVDVGGGMGQALKLIISEYPSIKGINFDLPHVIQKAPLYPGIEHVGGDMFESVPKGDAILLKHVCHNWSDEECVKLLKNCCEALPQHGKVIVLDCVMPEIPNSSNISKHTCAIDNLMFLVTGGKERTEKEFESLCKSSGFSKFQVACENFSSVSGVMEFYK